MRISARLAPGDYDGSFNEFRRFAEQRMEKAALIAVDVGRKRALASIRTGMQGAGLGRLGNGLGERPQHPETDAHDQHPDDDGNGDAQNVHSPSSLRG